VPYDDIAYERTDIRNKWLSGSPSQVGDVLSSLAESCADSIEHFSHRVSAVEHGSGLFIAEDVVFDLALQFLVDFFELDYLHHDAVDVGVQQPVLG